MSNLVELRVGNAGCSPNIDSSGRAPIEGSSFDFGAGAAGGPAAGNGLMAPGVPVSLLRHFRITPSTLGAANICNLQTPSGAGSLNLVSATGTSTVTITPGGISTTAIDLTGGTGGNYARGIQIVGQNGVSQVNYLVTGYDEYMQKTTSLITGPNGNQTIYSPKAWRYITSITVSGGTSAAITIGTADIFGFPVAVFSFDYIINAYFNNTQIALNSTTGFTAADTTPTATNLTNHVRGMYQLQSGSSNGSKVFQAYLSMTTANSQNMNLAYGVLPA